LLVHLLLFFAPLHPLRISVFGSKEVDDKWEEEEVKAVQWKKAYHVKQKEEEEKAEKKKEARKKAEQGVKAHFAQELAAQRKEAEDRLRTKLTAEAAARAMAAVVATEAAELKRKEERIKGAEKQQEQEQKAHAKRELEEKMAEEEAKAAKSHLSMTEAAEEQLVKNKVRKAEEVEKMGERHAEEKKKKAAYRTLLAAKAKEESAKAKKQQLVEAVAEEKEKAASVVAAGVKKAEEGAKKTSRAAEEAVKNTERSEAAGAELKEEKEKKAESDGGLVGEVAKEDCLQEATAQFGSKVTANRSALVNGKWSHVPAGCSVQSKGDWAAHWNTAADGTNVEGKHTVVKSRNARIAGTVGLQVITKDICLMAAASEFGSKVKAKRSVLVEGSWPNEPGGCIVQSKGDWAAHWNRAAGSEDDAATNAQRMFTRVSDKVPTATTTVAPTTTSTTTTTMDPWADPMKVGTRVDAQWGAGEQWYSGRIDSVSYYDRTYRVRFDDGDIEKKRTSAQVCRQADCVEGKAGSGVKNAPSSPQAGAGGPQLWSYELNARVTARWGKALYPGKISKIRNKCGLCTYDVLFDDGDSKYGMVVDDVNVMPPKELQAVEFIHAGGLPAGGHPGAGAGAGAPGR
jgi:hypothetical protein